MFRALHGPTHLIISLNETFTIKVLNKFSGVAICAGGRFRSV